MGRIKTKLSKRITQEIMNGIGDQVTEDFDQNKVIVGSVLDVKSKKLRNIIAGYATRLKKAQEEI